MIRLLGAITGSALALAALLVLVGVPQFKARQSEIEQVVVTLPVRAEPVHDALPDPVADIIKETPAPGEILTADVAVPQVPVDQEPPPVLPASAMVPPPTSIAAPPPVEQAPALQPDTQQWYAFWSPFRSEIAAAGFVTQLQRVTGLDYRVVKIKPGVYEVAFAYAEDTDIPNKLSQISAATGLDMPGN